jgi:hypothetical protein
MSFLKSLFKETADHDIPKKHIKKVSRRCRHLSDFEKIIPKFNFPQVGSKAFEEDIDEVKRCVGDRSLPKGFLDSSNNSVEKLFKKYVTDNDISGVDWSLFDELLSDLDTILMRQKYNYKRLRPADYFESNGESLRDVISVESPSFPSGHTAIAFFMSSLLSDMFPDHRMQLQTLAEMIGQSRIENGAHYPSDVSIGRFIGEIASDFYLSNNKVSDESLRQKHKKVQKSITNASLDSTSEEVYCDEMAEFLQMCSGADIAASRKCAKEYMSGYMPDFCTNDVRLINILNTLAEIHSTGSDNFLSALEAAKMLQHDNSNLTFRNSSKFSKRGVSHPQPIDIPSMTKKCFEHNSRPYLKYLLINYVKPLQHRNKKFSKVVLANDLDYNFEEINSLIENDIDEAVENLCRNYSIDVLMT